MTRIIGFEGVIEDADVVSYGAAAVELEDGIVMNTFTRTRQEKSELDLNLQAEGLTVFNKPWDIERPLDDEELVVVVVRNDDKPWREVLVRDRGRLGGYLATKRAKPFVYILFRDRASLKQYADETAWRCADAVLREEWKGADAQDLVRCGLVLAPRDPNLLALRVHLATDPTVARRTAERLLDGADEGVRTRFVKFLSACQQPSNALYMLKYEDGDQELGGLNLDLAVKQLESIEIVTTKLRPTLVETLPFVDADDDELPDLRFQHLKAASAELGFGVLGRTLRERVLRFLELDLLANVFRGEVPPALAKDPEFIAAVRNILAPKGGAVLRHRPIGSDQLEPTSVDLEVEDERIIEQKTVRVLGFVEGFYRQVRRAEVRFADEYAVPVSVERDGFGGTPAGVESLRLGEGLFQPAVFALLRSFLSTGRVRWHLQRMTFVVADTKEEIDTVPSSVMPRGLFSPGKAIVVSTKGHVLQVGDVLLHAYGGGLDDARQWVRDWQQRARDMELASAVVSSSTWYAPPGAPDPNALARVLVVLGALAKPSAIDEVVREINAKFGTRVRANNTSRVVRANEDLFSVDDDKVFLSARGAAWLAVLQRYGAAGPHE